MAVLKQIVEITLMNLRNIPQRIGASLVIVIGIAAVSSSGAMQTVSMLNDS